MRFFQLLLPTVMLFIFCGDSSTVRFVSSRDKANIFVHQNRILLSRKEIRVITPDGQEKSYPLMLYQNTFTADLEPFGNYRENLTFSGAEIHGEIKLSVTTNDSFILICPFEARKPSQPPYFMIPCFLYGTNNLKSSLGRQPKLNYGGVVDYPNGSVFYSRADRSSHPGVLVVDSSDVFMVGIHEVMQGGRNEPENVWPPKFGLAGCRSAGHRYGSEQSE
ncbi:hypothetical protein JW935_06715 [candidate division KSB1 bacterium]|nr:hypothetical protein [candidate division KSB1 bacterium]